MMHIRSRRILAAVSAAALLFTSVPSGAFAGEPEYDEALLVMQEEEVPEESAELQEADIPGSPEESAASEADVSLPEGEELSSDDQEVVEIEDLLENEEAEDPEVMVVEDGIPEENEEQILPDEEEILEAADGEEAPSVRIEIFNAEPDDEGVYRGKYSYIGNVIVTGTESDEIWVGWGDFEDTVPDGSELQSLESWHDYQVDDEGVQTASLWASPDEREDVWKDSLFLRLSEDDEWQKYSFVYDSNGEKAPAPVITSDEDLEYGRPYTVEWKPVDGAAYYLLWWTFPNGLLRAKQVPGDWTSYDVDEDYGMDWTSAYGEYEFWVESWVPGFAPSESEHVFKTIDAPEQSDDISFWTKDLDGNEEDGYTVPLFKNLRFQVEAPGADQVIFSDGMRSEWYELDENGYVDFDWNPNEEGVEDYQVSVQAYFPDDDSWGYRSLSFRAIIDSSIEGNITYSVINEPDENGDIIVPRDGLLMLEADPVEGVDYYAAYIDWENGHVDTHWVDAVPDGKTLLSLPVAACEENREYEVRVYAIKLGAPRKDSQQSVPIFVGQKESDGDVLISMKDEYQVYEPLKIAAWYDNPDNLDWNSIFMQVCIYEKADYENENWGEDRYRNDQGIDFRDDGHSISQSGEYVLTATVFQKTDDDPTEIARATHEFTVTAENGDLNVEYDPEIPAYFPAKDNYQLTIPFPGGPVKWINVRIAEEGDDEEYPIYEEWEAFEEDHTFTFDTWEGQFINVEIWLCAPGYNEQYIGEKHIPVLADPSNHVTLKVDGETDQLTVPISKGFPVMLTADRPITAIRVDAGDHWWYEGEEFGPENTYDAWFETGNCVMHDSSGGYDGPGTYRFYAQVTFDEWPEGYTGDDDPREWVTSNVILITAEQYGETGPFEFSLGTDSVPRGGLVTVNYEGAEHADHYWADIEKWYEEDEEHDHADWYWFDHRADSDLPGTAGFGTGDMEPGLYRVCAFAEGEGYWRAEGTCNGDKYATLEITDSEISEGSVSLSVDKTNLLTSEDFSFSIYAPGADRVELAFDYDNLEDWDHGWTDGRDGEFWSDRRNYGSSGTYQLEARAYFTDETGKDYTVLSDPVTMTVTAPNGELSISLPDELPYYLTEASTLAFEMDMPEHAEGMEIEVWYDTDYDRENLYEWRSWDDGGNHAVVSVSPEQLAQAGEGTTVKIRVHANALGYEDAEDYRYLPIVTPAATDKVRISVVKPDVVLVNQDVRIKVEPVNGDDTIRAMRFWDDGGYWEWGNEFGPWNHEDWFDSNGNFNTGHSWGQPGTKILYAEVTFDEFDDGNGNDQRIWYTTQVETVEVTSYGRVGEFEFSLDRESAKRGEQVKVTYEEAENADHYWVDVEKWYEADAEHDEAGWYWHNHYADYPSAGEAYISTADMEPGRYQVIAKAEADGWEGRDSETGPVELTIMESDIEEGTVVLFVDKTDLVTRENYTFSVYAPDADWIEVAFDFNNTDNWAYGWIDGNGGGESWTATRSYGSSGPYTLKARAHYPDGSWAESDPVTMTVTAHKGEINVSLPDDLPAYLTTKNDFTFQVDMPENAEHLSADVWYDTEDGSDGNLFNDWTDDEQQLSVTIRKEQLEEIGVGGCVRIAVSAEAFDYDGTRVECSIPIIEEPDTDRLDIVVDAAEALINEDVRVTVSPKNSEDKICAVRFYNGEGFWEESRPDWNRDQFDASGNFSVWENWWEEGTKRVYAQVTFDEWDDQADGDDGGRTWYTTDVAEINIRKNGDVSSFDASISKESAVRGELVEVTYTKSDNADHYWVDIEQRCEDDETGHIWWEWRGHKADRIGEPGSASFGTADLEPGEYRVVAKANGIGYEGRDANEYCYLTVTDSDIPEGKVTVSVSKTELDTAENFAVSVLAPGAKWIELFYDYQGEGDWQYWSSFRGGESLEEQSNYGHSGVYNLAAKAHYFEADENGNPIGEEVVKTSEPVKLTVTASKGEALSVSLPDDLPVKLTEGEDLTFTVQKPEKVDFVQVRVSYDPDDPDANRTLFEDWIGENSRVITVPADKLSVVKGGKTVWVRIYANAPGYDDADVSAGIPMVPGTDTEKLTLTVEKTSAEVNERIRITVSPGNAGDSIEAVRLWIGKRYFSGDDEITSDDENWFDEEGSFVASPRYADAGTYSVFALVTFDPRNASGEDTRTWYTTETVEINVTSKGDVQSPVFTLDKSRARPDETVKGTVASVAHAAEYWLQCEKWYEADNDHQEAGWYYEDKTETKINTEELESFELPMEVLSPGDYRVYLYVLGEKGYRGCDANNGKPVELKIRDPWIEEEEEAALEELKAIIDSLPFTAGAADEAAVARAREILSSLNDVQKEYLGGEDAFDDYMNMISTAKNQVDNAKAEAVLDQINNLPDGAGLAQKEAIEAAAEAYAALTDDQKALVDADASAKKKLTDAQDKLAAETVAEQLNALKANAGLADQAAVEAARKAYNSLTDSQKALVSADALSKLTSAETSVKKAKAAAEAAKKRAAQDQITITKTPSGVKAKAAKKGKVTLTWKKFKQTKKTKAIWKRVKQVEVQYSTDKTFKTGVISKKLGKKKTKLVVKKLKAKTTYYFRVRYIEGPRKVSKWSSVKKVKAKK